MRYRYVGDTERVYPTFGVTVSPGDTLEADSPPDAHFVAAEPDPDLETGPEPVAPPPATSADHEPAPPGEPEEEDT